MINRAGKLLLLLLFFLCYVNITYASCPSCDSGSGTEGSPYRVNTQAELVTAIGEMSDGEWVQLDAGTYSSWDTTVTIPSTKGLIIIGEDNLDCGADKSACSTIITGTAEPKFTIKIASASSTFTRISGFDFYSASSTPESIWIFQVTEYGDESIGRYRVDHIFCNQAAGLIVEGNAYGVIDNSYFYRDGNALGSYIFNVMGQTGDNSSDWDNVVGDVGGKDWTEPVQWGSQYFHYFEHNTVEFTSWNGTQNWSDSAGGGKRVIRYNTILRGHLFGGHDACSADRHSTHAIEAYGNTCKTDTSAWAFTADRGGGMLLYDNTFTMTARNSHSELGISNPVYRYPDSSAASCLGMWLQLDCPSSTGFCFRDIEQPCTIDANCTDEPNDFCVQTDPQSAAAGYCREQTGSTGQATTPYQQIDPVIAWNNLYCVDAVDPLNCTPDTYSELDFGDAAIIVEEENYIDYNSVAGTGTCEDSADNDSDENIDAADSTCSTFWDSVNHKKNGYTALADPHPLVSEEDTTPPTYSLGFIGTNGTSVSLTFSETVNATGYDTNDMDLDCTAAGNNLGLTYVTGTGTNTIVFSVGTTVGENDSCNVDYDGDPGDITDNASSPNDLADFSDQAITNNSTIDLTKPEYSSGYITTSGDNAYLTFTESVSTDDLDTGDFSLDCTVSGDPVNLTYVSGDDTNTILFSIPVTIGNGETCTLDYGGDANEVEDTSANSLDTFTDGVITNYSESGAGSVGSMGTSAGGGSVTSMSGGGTISRP